MTKKENKNLVLINNTKGELNFLGKIYNFVSNGYVALFMIFFLSLCIAGYKTFVNILSVKITTTFLANLYSSIVLILFVIREFKIELLFKKGTIKHD